jgi:hypothetical protein
MRQPKLEGEDASPSLSEGTSDEDCRENEAENSVTDFTGFHHLMGAF